MRKIFTLLLLSLVTHVGMVQAQEFTIASCSAAGGSFVYGPMSSTSTANAASRTAVVYPASQITAVAGLITNIYWNRNSTTGVIAGTPNFKIYLLEIAETDWGTPAPEWATIISGATLVYDGNPVSIVGNSAGWKNFPLTTSFDYSGIKNLAVFTEYTNAAASTIINWTIESGSPCINSNNTFTTRYSNQTSGILPLTLPSSNANRPLIGFDVTLTCDPPTAVVLSNVTTSSADISWTAPASAPANGYQVYYTTSLTPPSAGTAPNGGSTAAGVTTTNLSGLSAGALYYIYVRSNCGGSVSPWQSASLLYTFPANDNCSQAIPLSVSTLGTCSDATPGSTFRSTATTGEIAPSCNPTAVDDDVWYSFVATASTHSVSLLNLSSPTVAAVYSGSCGALTQLVPSACATSNVIATGLTIGSTYYVRVFSLTAGTNSLFNICVSAPPANDDCAGRITMPVTNYNAATCNYTAVSTVGTTISTLTNQANTCTTTGINDDVWYTFTTGANGLYTFSYADLAKVTGVVTDVGMNIYTGTCGALSILSPSACVAAFGSGGTGSAVVNLAASTVYTLRLYVGGATNTGFFNFCIKAPMPAPVNDNCAAAIAIVPSSPGSCLHGTTEGATASLEITPTCSPTGINDDVWYSFTATATTHTVSILNATSQTAAAIYSGTCGSLVEKSCASTTNTATGLTIGTLYYVRVYSTTNAVATYNDFDICISAPPANDDCANAVTISNGVTLNGNNAWATQTLAPEACEAATAASAMDVWYSFTPTQNGSGIVAVTNVNASLNAVIQVYSGTCGAFSVIGCVDAAAVGGSETVTLNGLVAGQTYYLRIYGFSANMGTFSVTYSSGALPINVEYFNGAKQNNGHVLNWKVSCTNSPSATMVLERSSNQVNFEAVHSITATAARCLQPFSYVDGKPMGGTNYYRLKSTDADGKVTYSSIIALLNKARGLEIVSMLPNPTHAKATVSITSAASSKMQLLVTDVTGRRLQNETINLVAGSNTVSLNLAKLSPGIYYLTGISDDGERRAIKFVKD